MRVNGKQNFSDGLTKFLAAAGFLVFAEAGAGLRVMPALVDLNPAKVARCGVCFARHGQVLHPDEPPSYLKDRYSKKTNSWVSSCSRCGRSTTAATMH